MHRRIVIIPKKRYLRFWPAAICPNDGAQFFSKISWSRLPQRAINGKNSKAFFCITVCWSADWFVIKPAMSWHWHQWIDLQYCNFPLWTLDCDKQKHNKFIFSAIESSRVWCPAHCLDKAHSNSPPITLRDAVRIRHWGHLCSAESWVQLLRLSKPVQSNTPRPCKIRAVR